MTPGIYRTQEANVWVLRSGEHWTVGVPVFQDLFMNQGIATLIETKCGETWWCANTPVFLKTPESTLLPIQLVDKQICESFLQEPAFLRRCQLAMKQLTRNQHGGQ